MDIQESGEMYLETIYKIKHTKSAVRAVDIVEELSYAKSSVSRAVGVLTKKGYITVDKDGLIEFTQEGRSVAENIMGRHTVLTEYLIGIGVRRETAEKDACRIEHVISDETFEILKNNLEKSKIF